MWANRMVDDYEVHVIGAYHSGDGEPAFAYDSRVHRLNILPKEPRIREANKELKKPLIDYIEQNHIEVLFSNWQLIGRLYYVHYARLQKLQIRVLRPWRAYE